MKIAVTLHPYGESQPAGLGGYILSLSKALAGLKTEHTFVFISKGANKVAPDFISDTKHEFRTVNAKYFWLDAAYRHNTDIDVWIFHNPMMPLFVTPKRSVVIALDFSFLDYMRGKNVWVSMQRQLQKYLQYSALKRSTKIVAISDFTKTEIKRCFTGIDMTKTSSIYGGYDDFSKYSPEPFDLPDDFFFCLGVMKSRKNQLGVLRGFLKAKQNGLQDSLVFAGKGSGDYYEKVKAEASKSKFASDVIFAGYLNNNQVAYAYKKAKALVFPSIVEGFGIPVLEAMSVGLPVITSKTTALGEVAGDAALTVDPNSTDEISDALMEMQSEEKREVYRNKGYERCKEYSWERSALILAKVVSEI